MDYKKKYNEALERAKHALDSHNAGLVKTDKVLIESMFPELKESEDEKIRKAVIEMIHDTPSIECEENYNVCKNDILAWLENQGEQKPQRTISEEPKEALYDKPTWSEDDERLWQCIINDQEIALDKVKNSKYGHAEIISDLKEMYNERIDWLKSLKQKIDG